MGRTILCPHCKSALNEDILKQRNSENVCLVCGGSLLDNQDNSAEPKKETTKWYYYKEGGGTLTDTVYNRSPLYTFDAVDVEDAKRQLKEVLPNSPLVNDNSPDIIRCPRCKSTQIQMVPSKFSFLTGFATNRVDRMCVRCKNRF